MKLRFSILRTNRKRKGKSIEEKNSSKPFLEACHLVRKRRLECQISRRELANKTKITVSVLEAIENGWAEKLPEEAYLGSMLNILAKELKLDRNTLNKILNECKKPSKGKDVEIFNPRKIDIFRTWHGGSLYLILLFSSIFGLNHQQRHLASINSQTFNPISPNIKVPQKEEKANKAYDATKNKLRLNNNKSGLKLNWITSILNKFDSRDGEDWLELSLSRPSKLSIESGNGQKSSLIQVIGNLKIKLVTPIVVGIDPLPNENDLIKWKGKKNLHFNFENNQYIFREKSKNYSSFSNDRSQNEPLTP